MRIRFSILVVFVMVFTFVPLVPVGANTSGTMTIGTDTTLIDNHTGEIVITADGVTLDCDHHMVSANDPDQVGILVSAKSNVTVKNCNVTGFRQGIVVESHSNDVHLYFNTANGNGEGFRIDTSANVAIHDNTANSNDTWGFILSNDTMNSTMARNFAKNNVLIGFALDIAPHNSLRDNYASGSPTNYQIVSRSHGNVVRENTSDGGGTGFLLDDNSDGNTFMNNTSTDAAWVGFAVGGGSDRNVLANNVALNAGANGFQVQGSAANELLDNISTGSREAYWLGNIASTTLSGNHAEGASVAGYWLGQNSADNTFQGNTADDIGVASDDETGRGFHFTEGSNNNTLRSNRATGSEGSGFFLEGTFGDEVIGNGSSNNGGGFALIGVTNAAIEMNDADANGVGFVVFFSSANSFERNDADRNIGNGFDLVFSDSNTLENNRSRHNGLFGFAVTGGSDNSFEGNIARSNGEDGFAVEDSVDNSFEGNTSQQNVGYGFVDMTIGSGTAGTANHYDDNECNANGIGPSYPGDLC
jgi:parallel beta-helix repeat protein